MRARLAIVTLLASGIVLTGGGAALGSSALLTDLTASSAQYGQDVPRTPEQPPGPTSQRLGPAVPPQPIVVVQAPRQLAAPAGPGLPFTGLAAIPLLLVGVALLAGGLSLRRGVAAHP